MLQSLYANAPAYAARFTVHTKAPHLVPEAGVEEVQHSVLSAAHVQVHRHPVLLRLLAH